MKRLYIPLPNKAARRKMISNLLHDQKHSLTPQDLDIMALKTKGKLDDCNFFCSNTGV